MLRKEQLMLSLEFERLQVRAVFTLRLLERPDNIRVPVSAHPLPVDVNIYVDFEVALRVYRKIACWQ